VTLPRAPSFRLAAGRSLGIVEAALRERFAAVEESVGQEELDWHDTFDWRIWRHGGTYETRTDPAGAAHVWRRGDGHVLFRLDRAEPPGFADELPAGELREALREVLEMRRLFPVARIRSRRRTLAIPNREGGTSLRVDLIGSRVLSPGGELERKLAARIRLRSEPGSEGLLERVARYLEDELGLPAEPAGDLELALRALGRAPGDYSSKIAVELDPDMRSDEAARVVLRGLLDTMLRNEEGTRLDFDSEFLHDFRVAVRRTRTAIGQIRRVFPPEPLERFRGELAWLGEVTGPTRDLDVYLLKMEDYRASLPSEVRGDLEPLERLLRARQRAEQGRLAEILTARRYRDLVRDWSAFLEGGSEEHPKARNAPRPIRELASRRIRRVFRRMVERGRAIDEDTPAEALHDIRIRGKKLRYLLEFFRSLYEPGAMTALVRELKRLQDNLGDFNDFQVQREALTRYAEEMAAEGLASPGTATAMEHLVARLAQGQAEERRRFADIFDRFASQSNQRTFERLFGRGEGAA